MMPIPKNLKRMRLIPIPFLLVAFFFAAQGIYAQQQPQLTGPTSNVYIGTAYTYRVQWNPVNSPSWTAVGGTVASGASSTSSITWNQTGTRLVRVSFSDGNSSYNLELPVTVTNPPPPAPGKPTIASNGCGLTTLQRNGTIPGGVTWYWQGKSSSSEITTLGSGSTFALNEGSGIYYIKARKNTGEWSNAMASDYITIANLTGGSITTSSTSICHGESPSSMTSTSPAGGTSGIYSYQWEYSTNGTDWSAIPGANAEGYSPTTTLTSNTSYRRKVSCSNQERYSNIVDLTVHQEIVAPQVSSNNRCGSGSIQLSAVPGNHADQVRWYDVQTGGTNITTGVSASTLTFTPSLSTTKTYYVESYDSGTGCVSSTRTPVIATIKTLPGIATAQNPSPSCGSGTVIFSATPGSNADSIKWYTALNGGTLKHWGANYPATLDIGTTTYYAASFNTTTQCEDNDRIAVTATVYANPVPPSITQETDATCSDSNGNIFIQNYNGTLYDYTVTSSMGDIYTGGPSFSLPGGIYDVTSKTKDSNCVSNPVQVDLRNLSGPFAPPIPILVDAVDPVCTTAKGSFEIQNYSSGNEYIISPSTGVSEPYLDSADNKWKITAPANTYTVSSREINTSCTSATASITIDAVTKPCGNSECNITDVTPNSANFLAGEIGGDAVEINFTGTFNCPLEVVQTPSWIGYEILGLRSIRLIAEPNSGGSREDVVHIRQEGQTALTIIPVYQANGSNFPGDPLDSNIEIVGDGCGNVILERIPDSQLPSGETWYWQNNNPNGTSINFGSGQTITINYQTEDENYYIRAYKNGNWSTKSAIRFVPYKPIPEISSVNIEHPDCDTPTGILTVNLVDASLTGLSYSFDGGINYQSDNIKTGMLPGNHVVIVRNQDCESISYMATVNPVPTGGCGNITYTGDNYVYSRTYQEKRSTTTDFFTEDEELIQEITYFDGLGRPIQQIGIDQSPDQSGGTNYRDIITHIGYDAFGRSDKEWLPIVAPDQGLGSYRTADMEETTRTYYKNHEDYGTDFPNLSGIDVNPYSQKQFEPSPLNRVTKQAAPGEDWKLHENGDDHAIEFEYLSNTFDKNNPVNSDNDNVRLFKVTTTYTDKTYIPLLEYGEYGDDIPTGYYDDNQLYKTITRDENHTSGDNHTTQEFTDKQGRVVLKRTFADVPALDLNNDGDTADIGEQAQTQAPHDTYYVYDDYGNLTYVLPPKMEAGNANKSIADLRNGLNDLGYQYKYDHRNRLVEKQIPGKLEEYIVYNKLDQPIMTQDANQRAKDEWLFTKYDAFGRVAYTGIANAGNLDDVKTNLAANTNLWETQDTASSSFGGVTDGVYYSNAAYPNTNIEILTINYYDNYVGQPAAVPNSIQILGSSPVEDRANNVKGLPTVSKVKVLDNDTSTSDWITSLTYYDKKGRPVYSYSENSYLSTVDIMETHLDFIGKPLKTKTTHTRGGNTIVTIDNFTYDHVGRLLSQTQCIGDETMGNSCDNTGGTNVQANLVLSGPINDQRIASQSITVTNATLTDGAVLRIDSNAGGTGGDEELIVFNDYDALGQLKAKKVGGNLADTYENTSGLQTVDYTYNVRGWLKNINEDTANDNDLFNFTLRYNDPIAGTPLFNGNISQTSWNTQNEDSNVKTYSYSYDPLNRITAATDNTSNYNVSNIGYDKNGNIQSLTRNGYQNSSDFTDMDVLDYDYDSGNKLLKVADAGNNAHGFKDGTNTNDDFEYDQNGNLEIDRNKGITSITYNHLNLPDQVNFGSDNIKYVYDATGVKLKKTLSTTGTETFYANGYIYEGNTLQFFPHAEGYVAPDGQGGYDYVYSHVDHLGSVRLSYTDVDDNGSIDPNSEVVSENNYYPGGLLHKGYNNVVSPNANSTAEKYKYQGQELEEELGKDTYAYQWRDYDPAILRFNKIDRFAEKYHPVSPYAFAANNPIIYREIQGDSIDVAQIVQYDNDNDTNILDNIKKDLSTATGLSFELKNGKLIYTTDDDGNAIIATDSDGNQLGSSEARDIVTGALGATEIATAKIVESGGSGVTNEFGENEVGGSNINLDVNQITSQFIGGAKGVDNRTMGFGMIFMHESLHSNVADGGANRDFAGTSVIDVMTGPVVDRMNIVRRQLNAQGHNFGQRQTYEARSFTRQGQTTNTILFGGNVRTVHPMPLTNGGFLGPRIQY